jgi:hypothetical protein
MSIAAGILAAFVLLSWLGLLIRPASFPALPQLQTSTLDTVRLREDLPAPVERFYRQIYAERVPLIKSAVISGRAALRLGGITFPARFRFTHDAGRSYRHYIEATFFGWPLMRVNEHYLDGRARLEMPFGVIEGAPQGESGRQPRPVGRVRLAAISLRHRPTGALGARGRGDRTPRRAIRE